MAVVVVFLYVSSERAFYYWDDAAYQDMAIAKAISLREVDIRSPRAVAGALGAVWYSTGRDYSDLHALPLAPVILAFGDSRLAYVAGLALVYLLPYTLVIGLVAQSLAPAGKGRLFWSAVLLAAAQPAVWVPTLRGYPDAGAAALVGVAVAIYLHEPGMRKRRQPALIGLALALAILFRRHFAYAVITFFACVALLALLEAGRKKALPEAARLVLRTASLGIWFAAALALLGWPFIDRLRHTNFSALYISYEMPAPVNLIYYLSFYGWISFLLALLGFIWSLKAGSGFNRKAVLFMLLFGLFSILQWSLAVKQLGIHYSLHFTAWIVLGLTAFVWNLMPALKGRLKAVVLSATALFFVFNAVHGLTPFNAPGNGTAGTAARTGMLFPARFPPQQNADYEEIERIIHYLRSKASPGDPIYVAASSGVINDDVLWRADRRLYEPVLSYSSGEFWEGGGLNILHWVPFADSRDPYPLEKLLVSKFVLTASPVQYHMRPEEQDVVSMAVAIFEEGWEFSGDFHLLPERFELGEGVTVKVYERVRPTSLETTLDTFEKMEAYSGERPGGRLPWMSLSESARASYVSSIPGGAFKVDSSFFEAPTRLAYLYIDPDGSEITVSGRLANSAAECGGMRVRLEALDRQGKALASAQFQGARVDPAFSLSISASGIAYLVLHQEDLEEAEGGSSLCWAGVHDLEVTTR